VFYQKSKIKNQKSAFTLVEILVAIGVFVILGVALVGLMSGAVDAWRRGEASRQVNEKLQALRRQIADDLAAAVLDLPPAPDFHYVLDTLDDLPDDPDNPNDPFAILDTVSDVHAPVTDQSDGRDLTYFSPSSRPGSAVVVLRIRVPFLIGAALLKARLDVFDEESSATLLVARNDPGAEDPEAVPPDTSDAWREADYLEGEGIGGAETDISGAVQGGNIVFIKATLDNRGDHTDAAQFLRADALRSAGRPVLILDCYRHPNALRDRPRPTFAAYYSNGAQVVTFSRTIPVELERAAAQTTQLGGRAQVVYRIQPYTASSGKLGLGVVRRAFEAPLRQQGGGQPGDISPNVIRLLEETPPQDFPEFIPNVLYLGMTFWGGDTTTWELRPDLDANYDADNPPHPASCRWLSSRYLPEKVQVTLVLESDRGQRASTGLRRTVPAGFSAGEIHVNSTRGFYNVERTADSTRSFLRDPRHFIKINHEWIFYSRVASPTTLIIPQHGRGRPDGHRVRGSVATEHPGGSEVYRGHASVFTVNIPAFRHWKR